MRMINISNNQIPPMQSNLPKQPTNSNDKDPNQKKNILTLIIIIPLIVGSILLGNFLLNKSNKFFLNKRDQIMKDKIDDHIEKKKEKEKHLIVPMKFVDNKYFAIEYKKDFSDKIKSLSSLIDYKDGYEVFLGNLKNNSKGYHLKTDILIIAEYSNVTTTNLTIVETIENTNSYYILTDNNNHYLLFKIIYKEKIQNMGINEYKYYGFFLSNSKESHIFNNLNILKETLNSFDEETIIYNCNNDSLDSCTNKSNDKIDLNKNINYLDYK